MVQSVKMAGDFLEYLKVERIELVWPIERQSADTVGDSKGYGFGHCVSNFPFGLLQLFDMLQVGYIFVDQFHPQMRNRISLLEKALGLRLLHRTTRRIELTEAGQVYFERSKRIVEEARLAHVELGDMLAQPTGLLRASLPVDFAVTYLAPLIAGSAP